MFFGRKEVNLGYYGRKTVIAAYKGLRLMWQLLKSCFEGGFWANEQPWSNTGKWNNGL